MTYQHWQLVNYFLAGFGGFCLGGSLLTLRPLSPLELMVGVGVAAVGVAVKASKR